MPKAIIFDCLHRDHTVLYCLLLSKISFGSRDLSFSKRTGLLANILWLYFISGLHVYWICGYFSDSFASFRRLVSWGAARKMAHGKIGKNAARKVKQSSRELSLLYFAPPFFRSMPQLIQRVEEVIDSLYFLLFRSDVWWYWLHHWPVRKRIKMQLNKYVP